MQALSESRATLSGRIETAQQKVLGWLKCGIEPRQMAFTLALGFALGCIPLLGITTGICAVVAIILRLNMPAIQAANWLAMPLQVVLLIPFLRLGQWLFASNSASFSRSEILSRIHTAPWSALMQMGGMFGHGVLAWSITAGPALLLMTLLLTPLMKRVLRAIPAE